MWMRRASRRAHETHRAHRAVGLSADGKGLYSKSWKQRWQSHAAVVALVTVSGLLVVSFLRTFEQGRTKMYVLRKYWKARTLVALAAGALVASAAGRAEAAKTYYIDECTDYTGNGCESDNTNSVTGNLRTGLNNAGWTGQRWVNADAWPTDFREACHPGYGEPDGQDDEYADTKSLAVFAGHGAPNRISYGYSHEGNCDTYFGSEMRLGSMAGAVAAHAIWLNCDALRISGLASGPNWQWLWQQFGFRNTIGIDSDQPSAFFAMTGQRNGGKFGTLPAATNAQAWLVVMDDDGRQPIAVSYGSNSSGCWAVHDGHKLKEDVGNFPRQNVIPGPSCLEEQPAFHYCYEYS